MRIKRDDIEAALVRKGFQKSAGDHSYFTYHTTQGKKTQIFTKTSHGSGYKVLSDDLVSKMSRQIKLKTAQFGELVSCSLTREQYESMLIAESHIALDVD